MNKPYHIIAISTLYCRYFRDIVVLIYSRTRRKETVWAELVSLNLKNLQNILRNRKWQPPQTIRECASHLPWFIDKIKVGFAVRLQRKSSSNFVCSLSKFNRCWFWTELSPNPKRSTRLDLR